MTASERLEQIEVYTILGKIIKESRYPKLSEVAVKYFLKNKVDIKKLDILEDIKRQKWEYDFTCNDINIFKDVWLDVIEYIKNNFKYIGELDTDSCISSMYTDIIHDVFSSPLIPKTEDYYL